MGFFERAFVGKVIKDFGIIEQSSTGLTRATKSALLVERGGKPRFILKYSARALVAFSISYVELEIESAAKLKGFIEEAERLAAERAVELS